MAEVNKWVPDIVIHHFPCDDGWIAAMIVYKYYKTVAKLETMPEFVEGSYSNTNTEFWTDKVRDKNVLVVDFSFKGALRKAIETACASMLVLDHHESAKIEYGEDAVKYEDSDIKLDEATALVNENKIVTIIADDYCGSSLAWDFFFPDEELPELLEYIEDQDLGKRKLPGATSFTYWLRGRADYRNPSNFAFLDTFAEEEPFRNALAEGKIIYKFVEFNLRLAAEKASVGMVTLDEDTDEEIKVALAFAPYQFASELANILLDVHEIQASLVFYAWDPFTMGVSIRGSKSEAGLNTNYARRIATELGGGGHDMAAGANFKNMETALEVINAMVEVWRAAEAEEKKGE